MRSPFHCDGVFFALLPQEKALPLLYLCPVEQVGKGSRTRGALSTTERMICNSENKSLSQPVWHFYRASAGKEKKKEYERGYLLVHVQSQTL